MKKKAGIFIHIMTPVTTDPRDEISYLLEISVNTEARVSKRTRTCKYTFALNAFVILAPEVTELYD